MTIVVYVHAQDDDFASSPLGVACDKNQLQVVKTLIENGAVVNYRNKVCFDSIASYDFTLLLYSCILNRLDGQVYLVQLMRDMKKLYSIYFTLM
jgi:ankyrin repeat protein